MRAVLQITEKARLLCEGKVISDCKSGMCILLGLHENDTEKEADQVIDKILKMRIFKDENDKLNLSPLKVGADILVVSNFTLYANTASRRPDFMRSMKYEPAKKLYNYFLETMEKKAKELAQPEDKGVRVFPGVFGGDMKVEITNDGPITIILDTDEM
ncbi:MAG: D-tyrosyl-tRNA(Tyr) deacylase [Clostridia bacterium]|nr:D-tyrosyl-tRNA(Tyr) deacylase [Clostridia bacterium]